MTSGIRAAGLRSVPLAAADIVVVWATILWCVVAVWPYYCWVAVALVTMADSARAYLRKRASSLSQTNAAVTEDRLLTAGV